MAKGVARPGGEIVKIKNPLKPDRVRTGVVLEWTSYGSPRCVMDDNHEERAFPADWVTVLAEAPVVDEGCRGNGRGKGQACACPGCAPVAVQEDSA